MTRVYGRRRLRLRRVGFALVGVAVLGAGVATLALAQPSSWGWAGAEQASLVAGIVSGGLSLIGTVASVIALWLTRPTGDRRPGPDGLVQIGRVPQRAAWLQDRAGRVDLARAARVGRTAVLTQVVSGMGGVGKTQLAAQFARQVRDRGELDLLVWVTADGRDAIVTAYAEAAAASGLVGDGHDPQQAATRLLAWLERTDRRWLVVLDNLDALAAADGLWPPANRNGRTVVTTRRRDAALSTDSRVLVEVDLFGPDEAVAYLTRAVGDPHRLSEAAELAADLGHLPLALAQAATFIRERNFDCADYRRRLAERRKLTDLLPAEDALPDEHRTTVAATWSLSIEAADAARPVGLARPVLSLAALLDPNGIPVSLFTAEVVLDYLTDCGEGGSPVQAGDVQEVLHTLHRFNLATLDHDGRLLLVHSLVQRVVREATPATDQAALAITAADALTTTWPHVDSDPHVGQVLRANASGLHTNGGPHLWRAEHGGHAVLFRTGQSLGESGQVGAAADYFQQLNAAATEHLGPDHADTLTIRNHLANWRGEAGDAVGAATAFEAVLTDRLRVLGPDHPDTLATRNNLAYWRGEAGDAVGAVAAFEALLTDELRVLGPDHPGTLTTRNNLALWRGEAGDVVGAATAFEAVLTDRLRVLGPDHPDTLATRNNLAHWRGRAGDVVGAVAGFEALLIDKLRVLGPDHPDTLTTRNNLAYWQDHGDPGSESTGLLPGSPESDQVSSRQAR